jgi:hypothetical protein
MAQWEDTKADDRSAFSFVKLFTVAAGLNAVRRDAPQTPEGRREMLAAAMRVGRSWDYRTQDRPAFFCAEVVAAAFQAEFPMEAFEPPATSGVDFEGVDRVDGVAWTEDPTEFFDRARAEGASLQQLVDLARLVGSIVEHDIAFLGEAGQQLWAILRDAAGAAADEVVEADAVNDLVPTALVTPRMLRDADWVEWVAPIILDPSPRRDR